jgi:hypothetical protein
LKRGTIMVQLEVGEPLLDGLTRSGALPERDGTNRAAIARAILKALGQIDWSDIHPDYWDQ